MKLFITLSFVIFSVATAMAGIKNTELIVKLPFQLPTYSLSGKIPIIKGTIHPANAHEMATTFKGSDWMKACCGLEEDYPEMVARIMKTTTHYEIPQDTEQDYALRGINDIFHNMNDYYENQNTIVYTQNMFEADLEELVELAQVFKRLYSGFFTSQNVRNMIEKICVDMHTNICWMGGSFGPHPSIVLAALQQANQQ